MPIRTITKKKALQMKCFYGGRWWIRTTEVIDDRFTVCSLWPLGKPSIFNYQLDWSWWTDLNPRPADYKSAALPTELHQLELSFVLLIQATITVYHLSRILSSAFFRIYRMLIFNGFGADILYY